MDAMIVCSVPRVTVPAESVAYGMTAVYVFSMFSSCWMSVMFFPYLSTTPRFRPLAAHSFTLRLFHSYSPPNTSRTDPLCPPRQARSDCGIPFVNELVTFVTSVLRVNADPPVMFVFSAAIVAAAPTVVNGATDVLPRS